MIRYPVAETFHSIQGEGFWTGTPMYFLRLAGCNVGKYQTKESSIAGIPVLDELTHSICTAHSGQRFVCDTDYHCHRYLTLEDIALEMGLYEHICITGGEPFLHNLGDLTREFDHKKVHIETSGTKPIVNVNGAWVTCCPKEGFLERNVDYVSEWKFLIAPEQDAGVVRDFIGRYDLDPDDHIYLQPINGVEKVEQEALQNVLRILKHNPNWKLSCQLHKYLEVR